jgi:hypothetical protein
MAGSGTPSLTREPRWSRQVERLRAWPLAAVARLEPIAVATLSLGAAAIHFGVTTEHFAESALFGAFFSGIGWFQALWAVAYVTRPARWLVPLAIAANAATVLLWAWAHLIGLPFGPQPGSTEPTTTTDLMATLFEILLVAWLVAIATLTTRSGADPNRSKSDPAGVDRVAVVIALIVVVAIGTTVALAQPPMGGG